MGDDGSSGSPDGGIERKRLRLGEAPAGGEEEVLRVEDDGGVTPKKIRGQKAGVKRKGSGFDGVGGPARKLGKKARVKRKGSGFDGVGGPARKPGKKGGVKRKGSGFDGVGGPARKRGQKAGVKRKGSGFDGVGGPARRPGKKAGVKRKGSGFDGPARKRGRPKKDKKSGENMDLVSEKGGENGEESVGTGGSGDGGGKAGKGVELGENQDMEIAKEGAIRGEGFQNYGREEHGAVTARRCSLRTRKEGKLVGEEDVDKKMTRRGPKKKRKGKSTKGSAVHKNDGKNEDFGNENGEENSSENETKPKKRKKSKDEAQGKLDDEKKKEPSEGRLGSGGYFLRNPKDPSSVPQKLSEKKKTKYVKVRLFVTPIYPCVHY